MGSGKWREEEEEKRGEERREGKGGKEGRREEGADEAKHTSARGVSGLRGRMMKVNLNGWTRSTWMMMMIDLTGRS